MIYGRIYGIMDAKTRQFLIRLRQAIIMILGALEEYLDLPRSITPKHKKP